MNHNESDSDAVEFVEDGSFKWWVHWHYALFGKDMVVFKKLVLKSSFTSMETSSIVQVLKPKCFHENRTAKELKKFLWDIEQYFKPMNITSMYLRGDAKDSGQ